MTPLSLADRTYRRTEEALVTPDTSPHDVVADRPPLPQPVPAGQAKPPGALPRRRALLDGAGGIAVTMGPLAVDGAVGYAHRMWPGVSDLDWNPAGVAIMLGSLWYAKLRWSSDRSRPERCAWVAFLLELAWIGAGIAFRHYDVPQPLVELIWAMVCGELCLKLAKRNGASASSLGVRIGWTPKSVLDPVAVNAARSAATAACGTIALQVLLNELVKAFAPALASGPLLPRTGHPVTDIIHILVFRGAVAFIVVGFLVNVLAAARLPAWTIYLLSALAHLSCYLYMGIPSVAVLYLGVADVRIYRRYGQRLNPMIVGAVLTDLLFLYGGKYGVEIVVTAGLASLYPDLRLMRHEYSISRRTTRGQRPGT